MFEKVARIVDKSLIHLATESGSGCGFLVSKEGFVVTAEHVIRGDSKFSARVPGKTEPIEGTVVFVNESFDTALLKFPAEIYSFLKPVETVSTKGLTNGGLVCFAGYPFNFAVRASFRGVSKTQRPPGPWAPFWL